MSWSIGLSMNQQTRFKILKFFMIHVLNNLDIIQKHQSRRIQSHFQLAGPYNIISCGVYISGFSQKNVLRKFTLRVNVKY